MKIHPIIYSDFLQTTKAYKAILVFVVAIIAANRFWGLGGDIFNLLVLFPTIACTLGTGALAEEYAKGNFLFIYTMPIKRWHILLVKMAYSLFTILLFLLLIRVCSMKTGIYLMFHH